MKQHNVLQKTQNSRYTNHILAHHNCCLVGNNLHKNIRLCYYLLALGINLRDILSFSQCIVITYNASNILASFPWFVVIYEKIYSKIIVYQSHYSLGKKYCRRCEIYIYHEGLFCPCCGMQLRTTPIDSKDKAKIRRRLQKQVMH